MKILGFIVFLTGLLMGWWVVMVIGMVLFEVGGVIWIGPAVSSKDNNNDHGP